MNKNVLVTAGTKNTGFCIVENFAKQGYNVHITSRKIGDAEGAAQLIMSRYPNIKCYGYSLELKNTMNVQKVFSEVSKHCSSLDVFVANAANLGIGYDIFNSTEKIYDDIMNTNVRGTFFCCREAAKLMAQNGGTIVLMSSVQSKGALEGRTLYGISKAAINAMNKYLAYDLAPYKIRVNCVIAGAIHTSRWDIDEKIIEKRRIDYPIGKESDMQDIANGILYLATDASKTVTGSELVIDSGRLVGLLPYRDKKQFKREGF